MQGQPAEVEFDKLEIISPKIVPMQVPIKLNTNMLVDYK